MKIGVRFYLSQGFFMRGIFKDICSFAYEITCYQGYYVESVCKYFARRFQNALPVVWLYMKEKFRSPPFNFGVFHGYSVRDEIVNIF